MCLPRRVGKKKLAIFPTERTIPTFLASYRGRHLPLSFPCRVQIPFQASCFSQTPAATGPAPADGVDGGQERASRRCPDASTEQHYQLLLHIVDICVHERRTKYRGHCLGMNRSLSLVVVVLVVVALICPSCVVWKEDRYPFSGSTSSQTLLSSARRE
ncbi:hypothetical protein CDEST_02923 [Colletotrichum destructivum]|uniref:Uncharacterized protein n=1 Tax=Colletotrichum destructivum TaxID=34406 RepID=A0AAX4I3Q9_9PEZI|nr:hypothetical protein CDEST_02923 [Colletotrichum destructivum]